MNFYTVKHFNGATYDDYSLKLKDYGTPSINLTLTDTQYLYIGNYKPFNNMYIELDTANINAGSFSSEYYDGAAWQPLELIDETEGFAESGFIRFNLPDGWKSLDVGNATRFYIRLQPSIAQSAIDLKGLGVLFSNDLDLVSVRSNIVSKHNNGSSWVLKHEEARKEIIGQLRRNGNVKVKERNTSNINSQLFFGDGVNDLFYLDITEYDILDIDQLREAAKLKALELIYVDELSDEKDDKWQRHGYRFQAKYKEAMNILFLKLDLNDDGVVDNEDNNNVTSTELIFH